MQQITTKRSAAATAVLFVLSLMLLVSADRSGAHIFGQEGTPNQFWWFKQVATPDDPVNVLFYKGGWPYGTAKVNSMLYNNFAAVGNMQSRGCGSRQRLGFRRPGGSFSNLQNDLDMETTCADNYDRWHLRGWDDREHRAWTAHGKEDQWVVGAFHLDSSVCDFWGCDHDITIPWDAMRRKLVTRLAEFCSYPKWRKSAGARGYHQREWNSGWIARISARKNQGTPAIDCNGA